MKVLFDTNILLDVLMDREPFSEPAAELLSRAERREILGCACATSFTTVFYLAHKAVGRPDARGQVESLLSILDVTPVNRSVLESAIRSPVSDFEDAVIVESARSVRVRAILTRNEKDFAKSSVPVHSPKSLLALLGSRQ